MRDISRFCFLSLFFLIIFFVLYFAKTIKVVNDAYKYTLPGNEIYNSISKSHKKTNKRKLILGDSTGNQFFNNYADAEDDSIYSLACNQAIGMCGHFFLLEDFLKKGNRPKDVYMIFNAFSFSNNLDQKYTYHYFLKPFYNKEYRDRMSETVIGQIKKIPYYYISQFPKIIDSVWAPDYTPQKRFQLMSPITNEYLLKIDSLQYAYDFNLYLVPSLLAESKKNQIESLSDESIEEVDVRLKSSIKMFIENITYIDDSCFIDGVHLKHPKLYKYMIEEKMGKNIIVFRTHD